MTTEIKIPFPIKFNPLKHHKRYILNFLKKNINEKLKRLYSPICHNYIDIYTGDYTPDEICKATIEVLKNKNVFERKLFKAWISSSSNYRKIQLPDKSEWLIREGNDHERYIHIHPAKTGPYTIRFKGSTLKTVYRLKNNNQDFSLEEINRARISIGLSPIKNLEKGRGIMKCWKTLFSLLP